MFTNYFFIDYENVNKNGLNGITKLSEEDCVRIYYSSSAETLTFGLHRRIITSKAHIDYIKVSMPIKNAVDCQILFDIRDTIKENRNAEYFIVSKDTDFDKAIEEFKAHKLKIKRCLEICKRDEEIKLEKPKKVETNQSAENAIKKITKKKREAQIRSFFGQHFKEKNYIEHKEEIIKIVLEAKSKQQVNNNLMKIYSNETVSEIYKKLQPLIKDLQGR